MYESSCQKLKAIFENIYLYKLSLVDPLPRLFKLFWFIEHMDALVFVLIFAGLPIIY